MPQYNDIIGRGSPTDPLIPEAMVRAVIEELPKSSVMLSRARRVPMTTKTHRQPVLSALPQAYWVGGDTGMKQTTKAEWENVFITAEELAALVPIPDAYFDDSSIPLWDSIRPLLAEAVGKAVDEAALFGILKPATWPTAIVPSAISAGNVVIAGTGDDLAADVAAVGEQVAVDGFGINGFASRPGLNWRLVGLRDNEGRPIYQPSLAAGTPSTLYGLPLNEVMNGAWQADTAELLAADWSKFVVGVRQDMTFRIFSEGVISDDEGKVILNLMQQDTKVMRVVFRVGFQVANPITRVQPTAADRYPAGVVLTAGSVISS